MQEIVVLTSKLTTQLGLILTSKNDHLFISFGITAAFFNGAHLFSELLTLFMSSFVSATLFPGGSELLLVYYVKINPNTTWYYFVSATIGNSLGGLLSYCMGYYWGWGRHKMEKKHHKAWGYCQRHGAFALLFSWLPLFGDLLPLVAGWLRLAILPCALLLVTGKALRYGVIVITTLYFL